jgi:hypothetical protein
VHHHHALSESARHEKVSGLLNFAPRPDPEGGDPDEVSNDDERVEEVES